MKSDSSEPVSLHFSRHVLGLCFLALLITTIVLRQSHNITHVDHLTAITANYIGDASFALTGSLAAGMEGMDLLGCIVVGIVTALGGGTIRDVLLGRLAVFWMVGWDEIVLCVAVAASTFFLWPKLSHKFRLTSGDEWLFLTDTLGLAVFAANGAFVGATLSDPSLHFMACACCGMFTATFGGCTRDVLIGRPPRILYSHAELYAVPAFVGGCATTVVVRCFPERPSEAILFGCWVTALGRVFAYNHNLHLPTFPAEDVYSLAARPRDAAAALAKQEEEDVSRSREAVPKLMASERRVTHST